MTKWDNLLKFEVLPQVLSSGYTILIMGLRIIGYESLSRLLDMAKLVSIYW